MPAPTSAVDSAHAIGGWESWPRPTQPALVRTPWSWDRLAWWNLPITDAPVDLERTNRLIAVDVPIVVEAGGPPWAGTVLGFPFQVIAEKGLTRTKVWDEGRPMRWFPPRPPIVEVPLPDVVRRQCDPAGVGWDMHWIGWDPTEAAYWEAFVLRPNTNPFYGLFGARWASGYVGVHTPTVCRWDETKAWDAPSQPSGTNATRLPYLPLLARWEEVASGRIDHALFGALPLYDRGFVAPARWSDGRAPGHPIRGGERLRLRRSAVERHQPGTVARIIAEALHRHGWVCGDTSGRGCVELTQDRRHHDGADGLVGLGKAPLTFRLTDCDVVITT